MFGSITIKFANINYFQSQLPPHLDLFFSNIDIFIAFQETLRGRAIEGFVTKHSLNTLHHWFWIAVMLVKSKYNYLLWILFCIVDSSFQTNVCLVCNVNKHRIIFFCRDYFVHAISYIFVLSASFTISMRISSLLLNKKTLKL